MRTKISAEVYVHEKQLNRICPFRIVCIEAKAITFLKVSMNFSEEFYYESIPDMYCSIDLYFGIALHTGKTSEQDLYFWEPG